MTQEIQEDLKQFALVTVTTIVMFAIQIALTAIALHLADGVWDPVAVWIVYGIITFNTAPILLTCVCAIISMPFMLICDGVKACFTKNK